MSSCTAVTSLLTQASFVLADFLLVETALFETLAVLFLVVEDFELVETSFAPLITE